MKQDAMRDVYQTSIRNFGPAKPPKRAPVDKVDCQLAELGAQIETLCTELAALPVAERDAKQAQLNALVEQRTTLRLERDELIRRTFYK